MQLQSISWILTTALTIGAIWYSWNLCHRKNQHGLIQVSYPIELLPPVVGSYFAGSNISNNALTCFSNRDYPPPTYRESLLCMLFVPGVSCNNIWGSRSVVVEVNGSVEFLKLSKLPQESNYKEHIHLEANRWLQLSSLHQGSHMKEVKVIPAEPVYICARSIDWTGEPSQFRVSFRSGFIREKDRDLCITRIALHLAMVLAVGSAWLMAYLAAFLTAITTYQNAIRYQIVITSFSVCIVGLAPLMLLKRNRDKALHYYRYFFTRKHEKETKEVIKKNIPLFQALFFSSAVVCIGSAGFYLLYFYAFINRELRNTLLQLSFACALSWFVFAICRALEEFCREYAWLILVFILSHLFDNTIINPNAKDEIYIIVILLSLAVKTVASKIFYSTSNWFFLKFGGISSASSNVSGKDNVSNSGIVNNVYHLKSHGSHSNLNGLGGHHTRTGQHHLKLKHSHSSASNLSAHGGNLISGNSTPISTTMSSHSQIVSIQRFDAISLTTHVLKSFQGSIEDVRSEHVFELPFVDIGSNISQKLVNKFKRLKHPIHQKVSMEQSIPIQQQSIQTPNTIVTKVHIHFHSIISSNLFMNNEIFKDSFRNNLLKSVEKFNSFGNVSNSGKAAQCIIQFSRVQSVVVCECRMILWNSTIFDNFQLISHITNEWKFIDHSNVLSLCSSDYRLQYESFDDCFYANLNSMIQNNANNIITKIRIPRKLLRQKLMKSDENLMSSDILTLLGPSSTTTTPQSNVKRLNNDWFLLLIAMFFGINQISEISIFLTLICFECTLTIDENEVHDDNSEVVVETKFPLLFNSENSLLSMKMKVFEDTMEVRGNKAFDEKDDTDSVPLLTRIKSVIKNLRLNDFDNNNKNNENINNTNNNIMDFNRMIAVFVTIASAVEAMED